VLHPKKTIRIQGIQLTNLLPTDLAVHVRVRKHLKEIAVSAVETD
jgi:hypothetical protein